MTVLLSAAFLLASCGKAEPELEPTGYPTGQIQLTYLFFGGELYLYSDGTVKLSDETLEPVGKVEKTDNVSFPNEEFEASRLTEGQEIFRKASGSDDKLYVRSVDRKDIYMIFYSIDKEYEKQISSMAENEREKEAAAYGEEAERSEDSGFEQAVNDAKVIFEGIPCGAAERTDEGVRAKVRVETVYRGELKPGDEVTVLDREGKYLLADRKYLFLTNPYASVFTKMPVTYFIEASVEDTDKVKPKAFPELSGLQFTDVIEKLKKCTDGKFDGEKIVVTGRWTDSTDRKEIMDFADCVLKVRVTGTENDSIPDRTTYRCTVLERKKGDAADEIRVTFFKNGLEEGKEYFLILTGSAEENYTPAAEKSILPADYSFDE